MAFDFALAELLARASAYSYSDDPAPPADLCTPVAPVVTKLKQSGKFPTSYATLLQYPDRVIVAYRGTMMNIPDWIQNFREALVPAYGARVHQGFLDELNKVQKKVLAAVRKVRKGRRLYVTGHSQGGAVALLATRSFEAAKIPVAETYTFAAPRPGDAAFRDSLKAAVHRIEHGNDIVSHVPPAFGELPQAGTFAEIMFRAALRGAPDLLKIAIRLVELAKDYESVGALCYGEPGGFVMPDLSPSQERQLTVRRLANLLIGGGTLMEHHKVENYVRIVDRF